MEKHNYSVNKYQLTHQQKGIWYIDKLYPNTTIGIIPATVRVTENVDLDAMEIALNAFIEKNDAMRFRVVENGGEPLQYVKQYEYEEFDRYEFGSNEELYNWDREQSKIVMDTDDSKLYYFALIKVGENGGFYMRLHHLISDAATMVMLASNVLSYYTSLKNGISIEFDRTYSYVDYIESEKKYFESKRFENDKIYWDSLLSDWDGVCALKNRKSTGISSLAKRRTFILPDKLSELVHKYCAENEVSEFSMFLAAVSMYMNRVVGKETVFLGTTLLNRTNTAEKNTAGMFTSLGTPLRINLTGEMNFKGLIENISREIMSALRHQKYPYDMMLRTLRENKKTSDNLFDVVVTYQSSKIAADCDYISRWHFNNHQVESLLININDREGGGRLIIDYDYLVDVFCTTEIEFIHQHIVNILWHALDNTQKKIADLNMLSEKEKAKILREFNDTEAYYPSDKTMPQLLDEQVKKTPKNIAVACGNEYITYEELKERSDRLAARLQRLGVGKDRVVGLVFYRSIDMIVAAWGVMKACGAYLPIDPKNPKDRIEHMIYESGAQVILTHNAAKFDMDCDCIVLNLDEEDSYAEEGARSYIYPRPNYLAYVIYTSGSTGKPKGAMLEHKGLVNRLWWMQKRYPLTEESVILQKTPYTFDVSVWELMLWTLTGASVYMLTPGGEKDPSVIIDAIREQKITTMHFVPSMLNAFLQYLEGSGRVDELVSLKQVFASGEALALEHVNKFNKLLNETNGTELYNLYGPTEATVDVSYFDCSPEVNVGCIPIGKPVDNTSLYILDKNLNILPIGVPGELYIGGIQLARGYINQPELTNERFIDNPYEEGGRIYKTGDLARWFSRGDIEYLGRLDNQLKIRGFRVELGEIENKLVQHAAINDAVVIGIDYAGQKHLCAYYVASRDVADRDLRAHIQKKLPEYMVPSFFVRLEAIPLSANGKADRKALPIPLIADEKRSYCAPTNEVETKLCEIAKKILKIDRLGIDDNLFEIGADSLSVIAIVTEVYEYGWGLNASDFYTYNTIRELAAKAMGMAHEEKDDIEIEKPSICACMYDCNIKERELGDILLTGATGFLGSHILEELIKLTNSEVYCLVRAKDNKEAEQRLEKIVKYYFGENTEILRSNRVHVICGDVSEKYLGISADDYETLSNTIKTVVHSAASVKYFGAYEQIKKINVHGTSEVIDFCNRIGCLLCHISTLSIAGNYLVEQQIEGELTENDFYIGQNYKGNIYVRSKFEAENAVLKAIRENGLRAIIMRMGDMTSRWSDGKFQINEGESAFYAAVNAIISQGLMSSSIINEEMEFSPVDCAAHAVVKLLCDEYSDGRVYHITNPNTIEAGELIGHLNSLGKNIDIVNADDIDYSSDEHSKSMVYLNKNGEVAYEATIKINPDITVKKLQRLGFDWPKLDNKYISYIAEWAK